MFCRKYEILISRNLDNDLNEFEKEKLEIHLNKCCKCQEKQNQFAGLKDILNKANDESMKYSIAKILIKKKSSALKIGLGLAAVLILALITSIIYFRNINNSSIFQNNNIVNYPMGSIVYYEKKNPENYASNYITPMSTYYSLEDNSNN